MRILELDQRSPEWFAVRGVIPTASNFGRILTPLGAPSKQADAYMNELLAYWLCGKKDGGDGQGFTNHWMTQGEETEEEAVGFYEMRMDVDVDLVGFCLHDSGHYGCSPDGLVLDGGLEIKCPKGSTHCAYLLAQKMATTYIPQVQGSMLVTGRLWWDWMSYSSDMEPLIIRIPRDEIYVEKLHIALTEFTKKMEIKKQILTELGYQHAA